MAQEELMGFRPPKGIRPPQFEGKRTGRPKSRTSRPTSSDNVRPDDIPGDEGTERCIAVIKRLLAEFEAEDAQRANGR
jgi:hypothetical protein